MALWQLSLILLLSSLGRFHDFFFFSNVVSRYYRSNISKTLRFSGAVAMLFTLLNKCNRTIWPGILPRPGFPGLMNGGLELKPLRSISIPAPRGWSGHFWARDGCIFNRFGKGNCTAGDCGGLLSCAGVRGAQPITLAEFGPGYGISLVDGYNIPISISPLGGLGNCAKIRCALPKFNLQCPTELQVRRNGQPAGCMSACMAFDKPAFCCTDAFNDSKLCQPTRYSKLFKGFCPTASTYRDDTATSNFMCKGADYLVSFC
ncbi:hypothetical protein RJ640_001631 [Escallonia rubra]|uniref:Thaumatin-like protein n=1 Tax=Escallonia rubra TaxID=112253 RepID=A0AA88R114_9ASTE|nr:hypothetical protein RJ640_001631 [Escallonia rubra]